MIKLISPSLFTLLMFINTANAEVTNINASQLQKLLDQNANLIDIRRLDEWESIGVIEKSIPITFFDKLGRYDTKNWLAELNGSITGNQPIVLICHAGTRSKMVAEWLDRNTEYNPVYNASMGIKGWMEQGNPVVALE